MSSSEGEMSEVEEQMASDDSDLELQIAFKEGILQKNGLNIQAPKEKVRINKKDEMKTKLSQVSKKRDWIETLDVTFGADYSYNGPVSNDFDRESAFKKQAQNAVSIALPRLKSLGVPVFRPDDYFAEMAKSDFHMDKVRKRLLSVKKEGERRDSKKRLREEKKFAVKVQRATKEKRQKDKRMLMEAVKKHRKGMKDQLDTMLNNASRMQLDEDEEPSRAGPRGRSNKQQNRKISRTSRDKKFGFGGQKKRSKRNDKESFESAFGRNAKQKGMKRKAR
ncbi:eukaryotic rRNA processing protein EBP2 domain-containing protein [Ditylenchus destructor]|nr:eukaryotic rRNA processing protein EBP2 domain-containing protein [Ditylenchus destructor]